MYKVRISGAIFRPIVSRGEFVLRRAVITVVLDVIPQMYQYYRPILTSGSSSCDTRAYYNGFCEKFHLRI